jgi:hypothetical protein
MPGQHHVLQDKDYVSKVDPAVVAAFLKRFGSPPVANRDAYNATQSRHPDGYSAPVVTMGLHTGVPPMTYLIGQDMPLAPATYGFADRNAVNQWFERAFDTPF